MMWNIGDLKEESEDPVKSWERPWNTDEMRQQSAGWTLAGDAGLLRHLQQFSQNLLSQTHVMEVTLDSLMEQLRATSTDVNNVTSQFLCLSDTQFLENRVYDDDNDDDDKEEEKEEEMPSEEKEEEPKSKEEQEAEVVSRIHEALALGMSVLDNMFDSVEVPASDSEDEESGGRLVLEPRNPYLSRALPYLIGCRQFMEDDYVGLGSLSDSEENGVNKNLILSSDSESEMDIEHKNTSKKRMRTSVSAGESSETDTEEGPAPGKQKKAEDDTIAATNTAQSDMFGGDSPTEEVGVGGIHDNFAAELAQKLGVAAAAGVSEPRVEGNKHTVKWDGDDGNDLFRQRDGKFSGGQGLFDDLEDSSGSLWGSKDKLTIDKGVKNPTEAWLFGPGTGSENGTEKTKRLLSVATSGVATSTPETQTDDLFLFIDSDISNIKNSPQLDGDLCTAPKQPPRNPGQVIVDQQPVSNKKKKPAGAVSIFGSVDVFKAGIRKPPSCSSCSSDGSECAGDTSSGIGQTRSEHQDSTKSPGTSAAATSSKISLFDPAAVLNKAIASSYLFQDETVGDDDSLFSNPQKGIAPSSDKSASGGGPISNVGAASQKHISLFSDSDSGDDEILFSSTSSASSRSRRSQGSGDLLATSGDKGRSAAVPKKGPVDNEDLFGGTKDGPVFDIFSTVVNTMGKPEGIEDGNKDIFSGQLNDQEYNLFGPSDKITSGTTFEEKLKHDGKDILFGVGGGDEHFDILGGSGDAESVRTMTQVSVGHNSQSSFKDNNWGLFSNSGTDSLLGDIFAVPVNKSQCEHLPSKAMVVDSLFPGGSVLEDSTDNLFASPVKPRKWSQDIMKTDGINGQIDDLFSVPRTVSSTQDANENKVVPKDCTASNSEPVTESQNGVSAAVPNGSGYMVSSSHFSNVMGRSGTDLFNTSTSNLMVNKEPVTSNKPLISPKPKLSTVRKPPLLQDTVGKSHNSPACKMNFDKNISQLSSSTDAKETCDNLSGDAVPPDGQQASTKSEQKREIISSVAENTERLTTKEQSVQPSKLEPPKTLNIRKSTGFLFSSSSNEDEDLFGMSLPKAVTLDSDSTAVTDEKPSNSLSAVLQGSSSIVRKLTPFSAERHSESKEEISSKVDPHKVPAECDSSSTVEVWSVGASPRLPNIDPVTLLPGARQSLRENHSVEAAVSFDQPAQFNATLPNAGKDRARIQAKRRPPSRRARQEAVRTSGIFFEGLDTVDDIQEPGGVSSTGSQPPPSGIVHCPSKPHSSSFVDGSSNLLSPSTDEEDLFGVPQDLPSEYGSNKDDGQSLFSCAPVLSPLEPLAKFPTVNNLPKCTAIECPEEDTLHASKLLKDSSGKDSTVPVSHIPSNENGISVPDFSSSDPDICEIQPPLEVLHDIDAKKTDPLSGTDKQELFGTDSVFSSVKPIPELNASYTIVGKTRHLSDSHQNAHASLKDCLSSKDPLSPDEIPPMHENMQQSQSQEELFGSGYVKHTDDLFSSRKGSAAIVNDLFSATRMDSSIHSGGGVGGGGCGGGGGGDDDDDDDLFSSTNKEIKKRTYVNKSVIIEPKEVYDVQDNISFLSGDVQKQSVPAEQDLLSKNIKDERTPNSNSGMFGVDCPEYDDLLFAATSAKNIGSSVIKGSVVSSTKSSLFDEDDGDDLFGSVKSAGKSATSAKPMDSEDTLFTAGLAKKKSQTKMNKPGGSLHSHNAVMGEVDLFEDPLMVVTRK